MPRYPRPRRLRRSQLAAPRAHPGRRRDRRLPAPPGVAGVPLRWSAPDRPDSLDQAQALAPAVRRVPRRGGRGAWDCGPWLQLQLAAGRLLAAGLRGANAGHRQPVRDAAHLRRPSRRAQAAAPLLQRPGGGEDHPARRAGDAAAQVQGPRGIRRALGASRPHLRALADGSALPVTASHVLEVNRMVEALKPKEQRL